MSSMVLWGCLDLLIYNRSLGLYKATKFIPRNQQVHRLRENLQIMGTFGFVCNIHSNNLSSIDLLCHSRLEPAQAYISNITILQQFHNNFVSQQNCKKKKMSPCIWFKQRYICVMFSKCFPVLIMSSMWYTVAQMWLLIWLAGLIDR